MRQLNSEGTAPRTVGTVLHSLMQSRKVRVWELANVLRCSHKSVYNYLSGASRLNAARIEAIAEFFDIEPEEFVNPGTGELVAKE